MSNDYQINPYWKSKKKSKEEYEKIYNITEDDLKNLIFRDIKTISAVIFEFKEKCKIIYKYNLYNKSIRRKVLTYCLQTKTYSEKHYCERSNFDSENYCFHSDSKICLKNKGYRSNIMKYIIYCNNHVSDYVSIYKDHYFYKDLRYDICKYMKSYDECDLKYKVFKLRMKTKNFWYYWNGVIQDWSDDFFKENMWARQVLIDFVIRFNKWDLLYNVKRRRFIIETTPYFYFKGFKFYKYETAQFFDFDIFKGENPKLLKKLKEIKKIRVKYSTLDERSIKFIGSKNSTKEFINFFNKEACIINYHSNFPFYRMNDLCVFKMNNKTSLNNYLYTIASQSNADEECIKKIIEINTHIWNQVIDYLDDIKTNILKKNNTLFDLVTENEKEKMIIVLKTLFKYSDCLDYKRDYYKKKIKNKAKKILIELM